MKLKVKELQKKLVLCKKITYNENVNNIRRTKIMKIGLIGLGKMGMNLMKNMLDNNIDVVAYDIDKSLRDEAEQYGCICVSSLEQLLKCLPQKKIIWIMVPAGQTTNTIISSLSESLKSSDIVIDGGNSFYKDSIEQYQLLKKKGISFFDVGSSGGQNGARHGGNFMIGGDLETFTIIEPIFQLISQNGGYLYTGPSGSGHYLKMVHNGIEYGMMQSIGEGFDLLEHSPYDYENASVAKVWNNGSVIRSWLMELAENAFNEDPKLDGLKGTMYSSGEGLWTVEEALKRQVPIPVITLALQMRYRSLQDDTFTGKVVASLRNGFGGHSVNKGE
ncbi:phosphogluconate dehydrogenase (NAD(+)-dependent, decarboxylating) [Vagococcus sp.]|uniref:phosphogluconate dehydrogenase (NAD(+)-dependent, decarboxylating) n=1 Tax=Vagococcus sp. TaxID=1933889 RepID=UPI003F95980D